MLSKIRKAQPIIICGMPRSGTSMIRDIIANLDDVIVYNGEPRLSLLKKYFSFIGEIEDELVNVKAKVKFWHDNKSALFLLFMHIIDKYPKGVKFDKDYKYICSKAPSFEFYFNDLDRIFGVGRTKYIYCTRSPEKVWQSLKSMPWNNRSCGTFIERYIESHKKLLPEAERKSGSFSIIKYLTNLFKIKTKEADSKINLDNSNKLENIAIFNLDRFIEVEDKFSYLQNNIFKKLGIKVDESLKDKILSTKNGNSTAKKGFEKKIDEETLAEMEEIKNNKEIQAIRNKLGL